MTSKERLEKLIILVREKITLIFRHLLKRKDPIVTREDKRFIYLKDGPQHIFIHFTYCLRESRIKCTIDKCKQLVKNPPLEKIVIEITSIYISNNLLNKDRSHYNDLREKIIETLDREYTATRLSYMIGTFCSLHLDKLFKKYPLGWGTREPIASNVPGSEDDGTEE